jgi:hypothetical protein
MERDADKKDWLMIDREINCATCTGTAILEEYENKMYSDKIRKVVKFKMVSYICHSCGESFTTAESDTIVVNRIKVAMRCEQRKSKIKKYVS